MSRSPRTARVTWITFALVTLVLVASTTVLSGCGGAATPASLAPKGGVQALPPVEQVVTAAPAATVAPARPAPGGGPATGQDATGGNSNAPSIALAPVDRKIIKNAQLSLIVENTGTGVQRVTAISADVGGYVVGSHTFTEGSSTGAQVTISVPVDRFEEALNLVRKVAQKILSDTTSSSDVSDQYVDLQSRLKNLESTRDRIRQFLDKAATVDEALKVNQQLSDVESQIEQIKGKLNAMEARTSFSTITVDMHEPQPTATPSPTPTVTPTPTPIGWNPGQTFGQAASAQANLLRVLGDLLIWVIVVFLPYVIVFGLLLAGLGWLVRRFSNKPPRTVA